MMGILFLPEAGPEGGGPRQLCRRLGCGCHGLPTHSCELEVCYSPGRASASPSAKGGCQSQHLPCLEDSGSQGERQGSSAPGQDRQFWMEERTSPRLVLGATQEAGILNSFVKQEPEGQQDDLGGLGCTS